MFKAVQITLTTAETKYNLATLVAAVDSSLPPAADDFLVEADAANGSSEKISVGDTNISGTRYGFQLKAGDSVIFDKNTMSEIYLWGSTNGLKLNVSAIRSGA